MKRMIAMVPAFLVLMVGFGVVGCDSLESINPFNNENEVQGVVEAVDASSLTVDGIGYTVTGTTEWEGYADISEVQVGDNVEVGYEERGGGREALEVERI